MIRLFDSIKYEAPVDETPEITLWASNVYALDMNVVMKTRNLPNLQSLLLSYYISTFTLRELQINPFLWLSAGTYKTSAVLCQAISFHFYLPAITSLFRYKSALFLLPSCLTNHFP